MISITKLLVENYGFGKEKPFLAEIAIWPKISVFKTFKNTIVIHEKIQLLRFAKECKRQIYNVIFAEFYNTLLNGFRTTTTQLLIVLDFQ